jgi:DNA replication protein DnaC
MDCSSMESTRSIQHQDIPGLRARFLAYPATEEDAAWTCPTCGMTPPARRQSMFGETRYVRTPCACQVAAYERRCHAEMLAARSATYGAACYTWLGERWEDRALASKTFASFDRARQPDAYETTQLFLSDLKGSLVLHGSFGTGKTHLLAALCNAAVAEQHRSALFTTAPKLFSCIQDCIQAKDPYAPLIARAFRTSLLVIDDIDKAKHSDFREEIYFEIIDERVKAGRPTAISTNRLESLADYVGGAVCSRLKVGQLDALMIGADYREGQEA